MMANSKLNPEEGKSFRPKKFDCSTTSNDASLDSEIRWCCLWCFYLYLLRSSTSRLARIMCRTHREDQCYFHTPTRMQPPVVVPQVYNALTA